jgi:UDP-N-acetylglucosamine 4,6-dehydratase/5-epimerase
MLHSNMINLKRKSILITGATGSFGKNFVKYLLKQNYGFERIVIFSRDELKQHEMRESEDFNEKKYKNLRFFIGDIRDKDRLNHAFRNIDYIIHAAALKQVPTGEYNPFEVIKTNVIGTQNILDVALNSEDVKKVIALSTDKAVSPINLYGASKLCSDKLVLSSNNIKGKKDISFSVVRYGNVMGSRGSVLPVFLEQMKRGYLKITHKDMTRFNIIMKDAIKMVEWALINSVGGEIIVPKIPSIKVTALADAVAPKLPKKIIGIREGEKIHEELISLAESNDTYDINKYYLILNNNKKLINHYKKKFKAKKINKNFSYNSKDNSKFLKIDEIKKLIKIH